MGLERPSVWETSGGFLNHSLPWFAGLEEGWCHLQPTCVELIASLMIVIRSTKHCCRFDPNFQMRNPYSWHLSPDSSDYAASAQLGFPVFCIWGPSNVFQMQYFQQTERWSSSTGKWWMWAFGSILKWCCLGELRWAKRLVRLRVLFWHTFRRFRIGVGVDIW
jgi:hypothetical protein